MPLASLGASKNKLCVPFTSEFNFQSSDHSPSVKGIWYFDKKQIATKTFSYNFTQAGDYVLTSYYQDTLTGCKNQAELTISAYPLPVADYSFAPQKPVESLDDVVFTSSSTGENLKEYTWHVLTNKESVLKGESMRYNFEQAGTYPVVMMVSNSFGCSDTIVKSIMVEVDFTMYVPDAFTPNGDELNDVFQPVIRGIKFYEMQVFNRWGQQLFFTNDLSKGWDGTFKGTSCKNDSYIWKIKLSTNTGYEKFYQGYVTVTR